MHLCVSCVCADGHVHQRVHASEWTSRLAGRSALMSWQTKPETFPPNLSVRSSAVRSHRLRLMCRYAPSTPREFSVILIQLINEDQRTASGGECVADSAWGSPQWLRPVMETPHPPPFSKRPWEPLVLGGAFHTAKWYQKQNSDTFWGHWRRGEAELDVAWLWLRGRLCGSTRRYPTTTAASCALPGPFLCSTHASHSSPLTWGSSFRLSSPHFKS